MRAWRCWSGVVLLSACGLDVVGTADTTGGTGAGSTTDAGGALDDAAAEASPDGGPSTFCATTRADPSVRRCIDFDDPAPTAPLFGFESSQGTDEVTLGPSPLGATAGNGLTFTLPKGYGSRDSSRHFPAVTGDAFPAPNRIVLDVDVVVDELSVDYAALVALRVVGTACAIFPGVSVTPDGLYRTASPIANLHPLTVGTPFHVRLIANPRAGETTDEEIIIDGVSVSKATVTYPYTCNYAGVYLGAFFTSVGEGSLRARFDQIVLRVE